jgi:hypothetical protein
LVLVPLVNVVLILGYFSGICWSGWWLLMYSREYNRRNASQSFWQKETGRSLALMLDKDYRGYLIRFALGIVFCLVCFAIANVTFELADPMASVN